MEELESSLEQRPPEVNDDELQSLFESLVDSLIYISETHSFSQLLDNYPGKLDILHHVLLEQTHYHPDVFSGEIVSIIESMNQLYEILNRYGFDLELAKAIRTGETELEKRFSMVVQQNSVDMFIDSSIIEFLDSALIEGLEDMLQDTADMTATGPQFSWNKVYGIYRGYRNDILKVSSQQLSNISTEYEEYFMRKAGREVEFDGGSGQLSKFVGIAGVMTSGIAMIVHDLLNSDPITVCSGVGLISSGLIAWPEGNSIPTEFFTEHYMGQPTKPEDENMTFDEFK